MISKKIRYAGITIFIAASALFISLFFSGHYQLTNEKLTKIISNKEHVEALKPRLEDMLGKKYNNQFHFIKTFNQAFNQLNDEYKANEEWDKVIWSNYTFSITRGSLGGHLAKNTSLYFFLTIGLGIIGGLMYILPPLWTKPAGIKNNGMFFHPMTSKKWLGIIFGLLLLAFYIMLYWYPSYMVSWIRLGNPVSKIISGSPASQWFFYGLIYTLAILIMGIKFIIKYRHNRYQQIRTWSVMFFQTAFAFIIPEILVALNKPYYDFKNIWPLDYDFFYSWQLNTFVESGTLGLFMLVWGIILIVIGVPVLTYFLGKRWYCSWVCGCGGLAETLGDPFRHLSDTRLKAWKIERWLIHSVLVFAVIMTTVTLINYFSDFNLLKETTNQLHQSYGFLIGALFAGVIGVGFYPFMGSRVWCRFGCPLAAYLGLVQRFKSRFRITTNGGQCISCGNCSTYCEMGIDVRFYAQKGQNVVRASCVGCGICAAVCPRGVLKLENKQEKGRIRKKPILTGNDGLHQQQ